MIFPLFSFQNFHIKTAKCVQEGNKLKTAQTNLGPGMGRIRQRRLVLKCGFEQSSISHGNIRKCFISKIAHQELPDELITPNGSRSRVVSFGRSPWYFVMCTHHQTFPLQTHQILFHVISIHQMQNQMCLTPNSQNNIEYRNISFKKLALKAYQLFHTYILTIGRLCNTTQIVSKACKFRDLLGKKAKVVLVASNKLPEKVINTSKYL